ncbi:hypothetical protein ACPFP2_00625 [Micromonospora citrea]|uniref:hypothetical protein n=1 Tax=Micromonospora citrea TaxID=47855 RepID=UPI003C355943
MSRRHTSGFAILGMDRDPTPGDPDQIDQLARLYEEIRDDAQTGVRVLGRGGSLSRANGESMEKLRDMLDRLPRKLQQTVDSFDAAAQAYRTYARALRDQQTRIDTAMDQATAAVGVARRTAPRSPAVATPVELADVKAQAEEIAGARAELSAAQRLAADARRLREVASARCNQALDDAASKAIKPPPRRRFFQRIGDFFRNNPIFRLIIDIAIAVVGVVLPVVGIVLAAVAVVVTAAVQAANGNFELGTLLVGLVTLVPGAKLIGSFTRGAKSVAPGLVATARSGAKTFGEIGRNSTLITGVLTFGGRGGALGRQVVADFGKGVVEEVATVGLNKLGNKDSADFNAASIFGGAAAGAAAGGVLDGFQKGVSRGTDFDVPSGTGLPSGGSDFPSGGTSNTAGADPATGGSGANAGASAPERGGPAAGSDPGEGQAAADPREVSPDPVGRVEDGTAGSTSGLAPTTDGGVAGQAAEGPTSAGPAQVDPVPGGPDGVAPEDPSGPDGQQGSGPAAPPSGGSGQETASTATSPPAAVPAAPGTGGPPAAPSAGVPGAVGGGATSGPEGPRSRSEPGAESGQAPGPQADSPSSDGDTPTRSADTESDAEDTIEERAAEAVKKAVSGGVGDVASTAIENRQNEDEDDEESPADALVEAAVKAGAVSAAADAATSASAADDSTGFTKRFRS